MVRLQATCYYKRFIAFFIKYLLPELSGRIPIGSGRHNRGVSSGGSKRQREHAKRLRQSHQSLPEHQLESPRHNSTGQFDQLRCYFTRSRSDNCLESVRFSRHKKREWFLGRHRRHEDGSDRFQIGQSATKQSQRNCQRTDITRTGFVEIFNKTQPVDWLVQGRTRYGYFRQNGRFEGEPPRIYLNKN